MDGGGGSSGFGAWRLNGLVQRIHAHGLMVRRVGRCICMVQDARLACTATCRGELPELGAALLCASSQQRTYICAHTVAPGAVQAFASVFRQHPDFLLSGVSGTEQEYRIVLEGAVTGAAQAPDGMLDGLFTDEVGVLRQVLQRMHEEGAFLHRQALAAAQAQAQAPVAGGEPPL